MEISKSQINKLGKKIRHSLRNNEDIKECDLLLLQEYRTSFKDDIATVFRFISELSGKERKDSIVSFRIKRIESIISKIGREPTMALGNMGDIAGCRIIVYTKSTCDNLIDSIKNSFDVKNINDYTIERKNDGYTGYHIYIASPINPNKTVEIQIRIISTHRWASFVEIIDIIYNLKLKEGEIHPDFQKFIYLLSYNKDELTIQQKKEIIDIDARHKVYSRLNEVFIKNQISIRKSWLELSQNIEKDYYIIEIDSTKKSQISSFNDYHTAEEVYFEMFKTNKDSNFVLTHIEKPNFKRICIAYASYMMVKHNYQNDWNNYAMDVMDYEGKEGTFRNFDIYKDYVQRNINEQIKLVANEVTELNKCIITNANGNNSFGIEEWVSELKSKYEELKGDLEDLKNKRPFRKKKFWEKFWK